MSKDIINKILLFVIALSFIALAPMPYGYYTFLKIFVCATSSYICYKIIKNDKKPIWLGLALGVIAILFNPIIPIHLTKDIWSVLNVIVAAIYGYQLYLLKNK